MKGIVEMWQRMIHIRDDILMFLLSPVAFMWNIPFIDIQYAFWFADMMWTFYQMFLV